MNEHYPLCMVQPASELLGKGVNRVRIISVSAIVNADPRSNVPKDGEALMMRSPLRPECGHAPRNITGGGPSVVVVVKQREAQSGRSAAWLCTTFLFSCFL